MKKLPIPETALARHIAVLGETGSGKTHDTKVVVEHMVAQGYRVCILDTIKSDWWGMISSADGKKPGLPFRIIGGPRGHVPLHRNAGRPIGELVAKGALPLSIIDMADFEAGDPQHFFEEFARAIWRNIKGVLYLVIEEAHEIAPKERTGFGKENMAVYWAKKLATGSRTKGIRLVIASQRTQAVHNALLGSCGTMMAHSLSLPADQKPVRDWLDANILDKTLNSTIKDELAFLPTGTAWVCCAKDHFFEKVAFPKIKTFDNTATPDKDAAEFEVTTAAVDPDELRSIIGDAVKEAEANDPATLKKRIADLERQARTAKAAVPAPVVQGASKADLAAEYTRGRTDGFDAGRIKGHLDGYAAAVELFGQFPGDILAIGESVKSLHQNMRTLLAQKPPKLVLDAHPAPSAPVAQRSERAAHNGQVAGSNPAGRTNGTAWPLKDRPTPEATADLTGPQQRILNSLATWKSMGHDRPSNAQVAWLAGYSPTSTSYTNPRSTLSSSGLIAYPESDRVALTDAGAALATPVDISGTLLDHVVANLKGPEARILKAVAELGEGSNEEVATLANYSATSTSYTNPRSSLSSKALITYPMPGRVALAEWLRQ